MSDASVPVGLGMLGIGSLLVASGITGNTLGEILQGNFTRKTGPSDNGGSASVSNMDTSISATGNAGGFLPKGALYVPGRKDQGRDGNTIPGGPIIAPGDGYVVRIGSDINGFGPNYPIVKFTSGPYVGRTIYIGHTHAVAHGTFKKGQVLSHTGFGTGVGNATVPGWFEIGYADGGSPGPLGQPVPF